MTERLAEYTHRTPFSQEHPILGSLLSKLPPQIRFKEVYLPEHKRRLMLEESYDTELRALRRISKGRTSFHNLIRLDNAKQNRKYVTSHGAALEPRWHIFS